MTKGDNDAQRAKGEAIEQRLTMFAAEMGRIVGTIQAKAEGWMDRETLNTQIAGVRDSAAQLLRQLARATEAPAKKPAVAAARGGDKGRSGGVVDAPGKKHRQRPPAGPSASITRSQSSKVRAAKTMVKTDRRRGRG